MMNRPSVWIITPVFLLLSLGLLACRGQGEEIRLEEGITYQEVEGQSLQLDMAHPEGEGPFPALVFIHGGGWTGGNRQAFRGPIQEAAGRGYVAVSISYRLMTFDMEKKETTTAKPIFPTQIHDCKAAVRWLKAHAEKYHVDSDRIGVIGASAGGHLALLVGLAGKEADLEGSGPHLDQSSDVQAVVNIFGPTEMVTAHQGSTLAWIFRLFMGGTPEETPETYKAASPVTYVRAGAPPILTLHGDQDPVVPVQQAELLDERLKEAGAPHTLMILKGQGHGFAAAAQQKANEATWKFFAKHLKNEQVPEEPKP
ncbi:MAG: alpha/beta hydrolase [Pirellulaceae bacterium]